MACCVLCSVIKFLLEGAVVLAGERLDGAVVLPFVQAGGRWGGGGGAVGRTVYFRPLVRYALSCCP